MVLEAGEVTAVGLGCCGLVVASGLPGATLFAEGTPDAGAEADVIGAVLGDAGFSPAGVTMVVTVCAGATVVTVTGVPNFRPMFNPNSSSSKQSTANNAQRQ